MAPYSPLPLTYAEVDLNDAATYHRGYKPGIILNMDRIHRGMSGRHGEIEHLTWGYVLADNRYHFRTLQEDDYPLNRPGVHYMIDDEARRIEAAPFMMANGHVADYGALPNMQYRLQFSDWIRRKIGRTAAGARAWQPRWLEADFDRNNTPPSVLNKPATIFYNAITDEDLRTVADTDNSTGYLPNPTSPSSSVSGAPPSTAARRYYVTLMNGSYGNIQIQSWNDHRGETEAVVIDVAAAPDDQALRDQLNGGVANFWTNLGVQNASGTALGGRVYVGDVEGQNIQGLGYLTYAGGGNWSFTHGKNALGGPDFPESIDAQPPIRNNTFLPGSLTGGFVTTDLGSGAIAPVYLGPVLCLDGVYRAGFGFCPNACYQGGVTSLYLGGVRIPDSELDTYWGVPGRASWTAMFDSRKYYENNGRRYTIVVVDRGYAISHGLITKNELATGETILTGNLNGVEDVGDATGNLITNIFDIALHFADNAMAPDRPWNAQNWVGASPIEFTAVPGLARVNRASFQELASLYPINGYGAIGHGFEELDIESAFARILVSGDFECYFTRKGELAVTREPDDVPTDILTINDQVNIVDKTFSVEDLVHTHFSNIFTTRYRQDYSGRQSGGETRVGGLHLMLPESTGWLQLEDEDTDSQTNNDSVSTEELNLYFIPDALTADAITKRNKRRYRNPLRIVRLAVPLGSAMQIDVGTIFLCTHVEGTGAAGFVNKPLRCRTVDFDPNINVAFIEAYDLKKVVLGFTATANVSEQLSVSDEIWAQLVITPSLLSETIRISDTVVTLMDLATSLSETVRISEELIVNNLSVMLTEMIRIRDIFGSGVDFPFDYATDNLAADYTPVTGSYVDVDSLTLEAGTWLITASIAEYSVGGQSTPGFKLYNSTDSIDYTSSAEWTNSGFGKSLMMHRIVTLAGTKTIKLAAKTYGGPGTVTVAEFVYIPEAIQATHLDAVRIG